MKKDTEIYLSCTPWYNYSGLKVLITKRYFVLYKLLSLKDTDYYHLTSMSCHIQTMEKVVYSYSEEFCQFKYGKENPVLEKSQEDSVENSQNMAKWHQHKQVGKIRT